MSEIMMIICVFSASSDDEDVQLGWLHVRPVQRAFSSWGCIFYEAVVESAWVVDEAT